MAKSLPLSLYKREGFPSLVKAGVTYLREAASAKAGGEIFGRICLIN